MIGRLAHSRALTGAFFTDDEPRLDASCYEGPDPSARSLAVTMFANRIVHEVLNIQWRRRLGMGMDLGAIVEGLRAGIAARFANVAWRAIVNPVATPAGPWPEVDLTLELGDASLTRRLALPDW